ncbi:MAG: GNAT family N-acetyltransferase [Nitrospinae bacterium]|nr:GNAT family N-acetyltransferase [Nitrospinota bacterium]
MIRKANIHDALSIQRLICFHADKGQMLPRTLEDVSRKIDGFLVYEKDGIVLGTCSLSDGWGNGGIPGMNGNGNPGIQGALVEVRSLAVHPDHFKQGIGTALVQRCIEEAGRAGKDKIFVLTYAVSLFEKLGFEKVEKNEFPLKIWNDCRGCPKSESCDETAMIRPVRPARAGVWVDSPLHNADKVVYS